MTDASLGPRGAGSVVALCGGVGGAKLALGLSRALGPKLTLVVNTGDDFEHLGLHISPDLDTVLYTLGGLSDRERGWGRANETWHFMDALEAVGGETWFRLGDKDLALHVERTRRLAAGETLGQVTRFLCQRLKIASGILPMTDGPLRTVIVTPSTVLPFQRYFVEQKCVPPVQEIQFEGQRESTVTPEILAALGAPSLAAVVICPSNPYLSIDPILAVPGLRAAINQAAVPIIAISPLIGGQAVKGPTTKIMIELGIPTTNHAIAEHYGDLLDGLVIDSVDAADASSLNVTAYATSTMMRTLADQDALAWDALSFAARLSEATSLDPGHKQ